MSIEAVNAAMKLKLPNSVDKLVCISLADHHNRSTGKCFPKIRTIMEDATKSRATIFRSLARLEEAALIKSERNFDKSGRQTTNSYKLLFLMQGFQSETAGEGYQNETGEGLKMRRGRVSHIETGEGLNCDTPLKRTGRRNGKKEHIAQAQITEASASAACALNSLAEVAGIAGNIVVTTTQDNDKAAKSRNGSRKSAPSYTADFLEFWNAYPNKKGKANAAKTWRAMTIEDREAAKTAIHAYMSTDVCRRGYVQHGSTYLNSRTFDDYQTAQPVTVHANPEVSAELDVKAAAAAVELRSWGMANKRGWQTVRDFPQWVCDKLRGMVEPMTFDRMMSERMGAAA